MNCIKTEGIEVQDTWQNSVTTQAEENDEWDEFLDNDNVRKDSEKKTLQMLKIIMTRTIQNKKK